MFYVYILESVKEPKQYYVGTTKDIQSRLNEHNAGEVSHTSKFKLWEIKNYFAFRDKTKAYAFERYLKSGSGRSFTKRHF